MQPPDHPTPTPLHTHTLLCTTCCLYHRLPGNKAPSKQMYMLLYNARLCLPDDNIFFKRMRITHNRKQGINKMSIAIQTSPWLTTHPISPFGFPCQTFFLNKLLFPCQHHYSLRLLQNYLILIYDFASWLWSRQLLLHKLVSVICILVNVVYKFGNIWISTPL